MLKAIRRFAQRNLILRKFIGYYLASSGLFDSFFKSYKMSPAWEGRISSVLESADNAFIPRVPAAGQIVRGKQIMHNGLKIYLGSYYGPEYATLLRANKGVHEPQEERVFMEVLKTLPVNSTMIEMGAFWSFYSLWLQKEIKNAVNYMIEPDAFNLGQGKRNFRLNKMKGVFIQAFVGKEFGNTNGAVTVSVDYLVARYAIDFIHVLHSDIQGFEYEMLVGAEKAFLEKKIGYVFISSHSNELHYNCISFLEKKNYTIIASADMDESYSEDGLIVARAPFVEGAESIPISKRGGK